MLGAYISQVVLHIDYVHELHEEIEIFREVLIEFFISILVIHEEEEKYLEEHYDSGAKDASKELQNLKTRCYGFQSDIHHLTGNIPDFETPYVKD